MNTVTKPEAVPNYTVKQIAEIKAVEPVNLEKAKILADSMGKTYRSIIAKCHNEGIEYQSKPAPRKKAVQATKLELVETITKMIDRDITGLDKANRSSLLNLINGIQHLEPLESDS